MAEATVSSPVSAGRPISRAAVSAGADTAHLPASVTQTLRGRSEPLGDATRTKMESRFGQDFSRVRIFRGAEAERSAEAVNARAYTVGDNIVFGAGEYAPESSAGQRLLVHELAHVIQGGQDSGAAGRSMIHRQARRPPMQIKAEAAQKFKAAVERNLIEEKTPTTAREKSVDVDIDMVEHDQAVVNIVNAAIDAAYEDTEADGPVSEYELLRNALFNHVTPYRSQNPQTSQNLVLRDVDHYLTGRLQEWRRNLPLESEPPGPTTSSTIVGAGEVAAEIYDRYKRQSFASNPNPDAKNAKSSEDANRQPASAPGGRFWAWLGGQHLLAGDKPDQPADPARLKITLADIRNARRVMKLSTYGDVSLNNFSFRTQAQGAKPKIHFGP